MNSPSFTPTRRAFLLGSSLVMAAKPLALGQRAREDALHQKLSEIEMQSGGRVGVALLESRSGRLAGYRDTEPFPMCSTFKALAAAAILKKVDEGKEQLQRCLQVTKADLLEHAPVTSAHVGGDGMKVSALCEAALVYSDNTAANLLLRSLGGPGAVTAFARSIGDIDTRLDRAEPTLNEAVPGDLRDTTTPRAMANDLNALLLGPVLTSSSRALLKGWMVNCKTGTHKIRGAVPGNYQVADRTGSGGHNTSNDIAAVWPPEGWPFLLTIYLTGLNTDSQDSSSRVIAQVTRACLES